MRTEGTMVGSRAHLRGLLQALADAVAGLDAGSYGTDGPTWRPARIGGEATAPSATRALEFWVDLGRRVTRLPAQLRFDSAVVFYHRMRAGQAEDDQAALHAAAWDVLRAVEGVRLQGARAVGGKGMPAWDVGRPVGPAGSPQPGWLEVHVQFHLLIDLEG
jgi:hypothetical protein